MNKITVSPIFFIIFLFFAGSACVTDIKHRRIPDWSVFTGIAVLSALRLFMFHDAPLIIAAEVSAGPLIFMGIRLLTKGKLGMGDVKFAALMGVFTGFPGWFTAAAFASFSGLLFALSGIAAGKLNRNSKIPFAPFLTAGSIFASFINPVLLGKISEILK